MGIHKISSLIDTAEVRKAHALTGDDLAKKQVNDSALAKIIKGEDDRLLLVIGPCSSDNEKAVLDYAHRLSKLQEEVKDKIFIVMRVYTCLLYTSKNRFAIYKDNIWTLNHVF